jgi:hypothetical protein
MDYRRLQHKNWGRRSLFSLESIYRYLSLYGTAPIRAALWLGLIIATHMLVVSIGVDDPSKIVHALRYEFSGSPAIDTYHTVVALLTNSMKTLVTVRGQPPIEARGGFALWNTVFQLMGAVQFALLVLALRAKIKRN